MAIRTTSLLVLLCMCLTQKGIAQNTKVDTVALDTVVIRAYSTATQLFRTPAAVALLSPTVLEQTMPTSLVEATNTLPGVRMEERSPSSYRINIRGSSVRSPYGVRNVKIYYDQIPFTAPGGASMLNMLGFYDFGTVEIIKGSAGSLYGASTGGAILIHAPKSENVTQINLQILGGSFGLFGLQAGARHKGLAVAFEHLQNKGYRQQSASSKKVLHLSGQKAVGEGQQIGFHAVGSLLGYETPGALTKSEFEHDPKAARPATATASGAIEKNAGVRQNALLIGVSHSLLPNNLWNLQTNIYGFLNSSISRSIQNYEEKSEPHYGLRSQMDRNYNMGSILGKLNLGLEYQHGTYSYDIFDNEYGQKAAWQNSDKVGIHQGFAFAQTQLSSDRWHITGGLSFNFNQSRFAHKDLSNEWVTLKTFRPHISPRLALAYYFNKSFTAYAHISEGFSPPSTQELFADNNQHSLNLKPEIGTNYELGFRTKLLKQRLWFELNGFLMPISQMLVTRRDSAGANYFVNAGSADKKGLEAMLRFEQHFAKNSNLQHLLLQAAYAYSDFRYRVFEHAGTDFSGKRLPGVAPHSLTLLGSISNRWGSTFSLRYELMEAFHLNDANTAMGLPVKVLHFKISQQFNRENYQWTLFAGINNSTNHKYSLGYDINGFGGRYFNAAPGRNYYLGLQLRWRK